MSLRRCDHPTRARSRALLLLLPTLLTTTLVGAARAADPLPYEPHRRLAMEADATLGGAEALEARLRGVELAQGFRYQLAVVRSTGGTSLHRFALELRGRWSQHPDFDAERTFVIVCALSDPPRVALAAPRGVVDRLALSLPRVERALLEPFRPRQDLAAALGELVVRADRRLGELESQRIAERMRRAATWEELDQVVERDLEIVSDRLTALELRCLELRASGLDVGADEDRLQGLRRDVALAIEQRGESPEPLVEVLRATSAALAEVESRLGHVDDLRREAHARYGEALNALSALELPLKAHPEGSPVRVAARRAWDDAAAALHEAGRLLDAGKPEDATRQLDLASRDLERTRRALTPPPAPVVEPVPVLPWLIVLVGAIAVAFGAGLLRTSLVRSQLRGRADALREVTARLSRALESELLALRTLYLQATRPGPVDVPEALRSGSAGSAPRAHAGDTAAALARARGKIEDLHDTWRQLEQALARSDAVRSGPGGLAAAIDVLERAPSRKLPVGTIRDAAQLLERVAAAPAACGRRLAEAAAAAAEADALLERALQAGQSAQPFEDDVADVWERAREAALVAPRDPVGAALLAAEACAARSRLEERVERARELGQGLVDLRARLDALPVGGVRSPVPDDLPALLAWAHHLADEVAQALDEGARDEATRELDRALGLAKDCELLTKGAAEHPGAELQLLREDLHQAHEALDEMRAGFARSAWDDVEVALLQAAARIELIAAALAGGGRVPRLHARLGGVRTATLLATTRLLQLRGERERAEGLTEELEARGQAIASYLRREAQAVSNGTREGLADVQARLGRLAARARASAPPRWDELMLELTWLSDGLDRVRERAGREALVHRRAQALRQGLERGLRDADDVIRRFEPDSVGAKACMAAAREAQKAALEALEAGDQAAAIPLLQRGIRSARDAREMAAPRVVRSTLPPGPAGDAAYALLLLRHAYGRAHRAYALGLASEPVELREQLSAVEGLLLTDPAAAATIACGAILRADALVAAAHQREQQALEAQADARHHDALEAARARHAHERAQRRAELHRRTRFEVLVLGENEPASALDAEDIDNVDDDPDELAALDEVAPSEEAPVEDDDADADAEPTSGAESTTADAPDATDATDATAAPDAPDAPTALAEPSTPDAPSELDAPVEAATPDAPSAPDEPRPAAAPDDDASPPR